MFHDRNRNGVRDTGEETLPGKTVFLDQVARRQWHSRQRRAADDHRPIGALPVRRCQARPGRGDPRTAQRLATYPTGTSPVSFVVGSGDVIAGHDLGIVLVLPWRNPVDPLDVNGDGYVVPGDALIIINELNALKNVDATGKLPPLHQVTRPFST